MNNNMKKICTYSHLEQGTMVKGKTITYGQLLRDYQFLKNIWVRAVFELGTRKDTDQNKWTRVKIQPTVSINVTSVFISWWKGVLWTTAGTNPNSSSRYPIKMWSSSHWGQWNGASGGDGWGHGAVGLETAPLGYRLGGSGPSSNAGLAVLPKHLRTQGLK